MPADYPLTSELRLRYRRRGDDVYIEWVNRRDGIVAYRKARDTELALVEQIEHLKAKLRHARGLGPAPAQIETGIKMMTSLKKVKVNDT